MATRFVATYECDANIKFKEAYINCNKESISIVKVPLECQEELLGTPLFNLQKTKI